ncbi:MAG: hypothetical protein ACYC5O_24550 [Anaerolineae bacterium]
MKTATVARLVLLPLLALLLSVRPATADEPPITAQASLGTGFTYQGRLLDGGVGANGIYDIGFALYDALTGGALIGSNWCENVVVANGLFSVVLDFGAVWDGTAYWLQVAVRPGASAAGMTLLEPRTPISPSPVAISAHSVKTDLVSTLFVPAAEAVLHAANENGTLAFYGQGAARLVSSGTGTKDVVFPITIPGTLYNQPVSIDTIYLGYVASAATAAITDVYVYRARYDGTYREVAHLTGPWNATHWSEIPIQLDDADDTLAAGDGFVAVRVFCDISAGANIMFSGLELRLVHR